MCSICEKKSSVNIKVMENTLNFFKNLNVEEDKIGTLKCRKHPEKDIEFFCAKEGEFFCSLCIDKHLVHSKNIKVNLPDEIMAHYKSLDAKMDEVIEKALSHKKHIDEVIKRKITLNSI